ncbi:hypothetical protein HY970_01075 [Candidatus Kaiserbacteria bacterium]|nr:hypothetical protein [Candidatus Kaiserbacteria bacterium]
MRPLTHVLQFALAALIVVIIGGLAGWYFFLKQEGAQTQAQDAARGSESATFGNSTGSTYQHIVTELTNPDTATSSGKRAPRLWHVSKAPVAGFGFAATSSRIIFIERSTGNMLDASPDTSAVDRRTNTLFPKIYDALVGEGGVVLRSLEGETITTLASEFPSKSPTATSSASLLKGSYLPQNIVSISSHGNTLFFLVKDPGGGVVGATANWRGEKQRKIFSSPLRSWRAFALEDGRFVVAQGATDGVAGFAYTLDTQGVLRELVSDVPGLTVLPKSGAPAVLYGSSSGDAVALFARAKTDSTPKYLDIKTAADKCVWSRGKELIAYCAVPQVLFGREYLKARYEGRLHTTDALWRIDATKGTAEKFFVTDTTLALDIENLAIDASSSYIAFENAADQSLWMLRIASQ